MEYALAYFGFVVIAFLLWFCIPRAVLVVAVTTIAHQNGWVVMSDTNNDLSPLGILTIVIIIVGVVGGLAIDIFDLRNRNF